MSIEKQQGILYQEHKQRYEFIKPLLHGNVLDIACGTGYGAQIIDDTINRYYGVDFSQDAIDDANKYNKLEKNEFSQGSIVSIDFKDQKFDIVISFETLEHIEDYNKALSEILRVLKSTGTFVGSVPSKEFDDKCEDVYGKNPYHITRFNFEKIQNLLSKNFKYVEFFSNELVLCNIFQYISSSENKTLLNKLDDNLIYGSIIFIAANEELFFKNQIQKLQPIIRPLTSLVEYDEEKIIPLMKQLRERDVYIKKLENRLNEVIAINKNQDRLVEERDVYIKKLEARLK